MASRRSSDAPQPPTLPPAPRRRGPAAAAPVVSVTAGVSITREARHAMIAASAYLRAERRGFVPGRETEDWLEAEAEVDALLRLSHGGSSQ